MKSITCAMGVAVVVLSCMGKLEGQSADTSHFVTLGHSAGGSAALGMERIRSDVVGVIALESPYENNYYEGTGHMGLCELSLASPIL